MPAFKDQITPYTDGNGLVAPEPVAPGVMQGSDNGPMYTSEWAIILLRNRHTTIDDYLHFFTRIMWCINADGMLRRVPINHSNNTQTGPDDYYAVLNACKQFKITEIPRLFMLALIEHRGCLNNVDGTWTWKSFLVRQPQLLCSMIAAAYPSLVNPLHWFIRLLCFPLFLYSALVILTSCVGVKIEDTDSRRLSWHLVNTLKPVSLMCKLASLVWYRRLYKDYGLLGMKTVAAYYYKPQGLNPFSRNWVD